MDTETKWYLFQMAVNVHHLAKYTFFATVVFIILQPRFPIRFSSSRKRTAFSMVLITLCFGSILVFISTPSEVHSLKELQESINLHSVKGDAEELKVEEAKRRLNLDESPATQKKVEEAKRLVEQSASMAVLPDKEIPTRNLPYLTTKGSNTANIYSTPAGFYVKHETTLAYQTASGVVVEQICKPNPNMCPCEDSIHRQYPNFGKMNDQTNVYTYSYEDEEPEPLSKDPDFGKDNKDSPLAKEVDKELNTGPRIKMPKPTKRK